MSHEMADVLAAYMAVSERLPRATRAGECRPADTLGEIAEHFDAIFLDAYGVLNVGQQAVPGVPEQIAALQAAGKKTLVVSNAAGFAHTAIETRMAKLGYRFSSDDIITSRKALLRALHAQSPRHWGVVAGPNYGSNEFGALSLTRLADDVQAYDAVEGFLFVGAGDWSEARQANLVASLRNLPRPIWVANPDLMAPQPVGVSIEAGYYGHDIAARTGVVPAFYGKPFPDIYTLALEQLGSGFDPQRVLMVGDTLHTDILGGLVAGIKTALVVDSGVMAGRDVNSAIAQAGIAPDWIVSRI